MINSTLKKIVVVFLIITLTYANLILIGSNIVKGLISYAAEGEITEPTIEANQYMRLNKVCEINGEQKRVIQVAVETGINSEKQPIKETILSLNTNIIEGTLEDVKVTSLNKNSYTIGTWEIVDQNLKVTLVNENETLETKPEGLDAILVTYIFTNTNVETIKKPLTKVEVKTYSSSEVIGKEIEMENFEYIDVAGNFQGVDVNNEDIHKTTITDGQVEYVENINLDLSYRKNISTIKIENVKNEIYNNDERVNSEITLKYKTTTINKEDLLNLLGEEGALNITDTTTNKLLAEITKEKIEAQTLNEKVAQKFTEEETEELRSNITVTDNDVEIEYVIDATNLKLEFTNIKEQSENKIEADTLYIENTKIISNINNVDDLNNLKETIKYTIDEIEKTIESTITFKDTITKANLTVDNTNWVVGQANKVKYTVTLDTSSEKTEKYVYPMLLLELPTSVESVNTQNSEFIINNNNGAFSNKKVFVTTVMERKFVVITLDGAQTDETITNGNTSIDLTLELNVAENAEEGDQTTKLYYQNNTVTAYESGKGFDTAEVTVSMIMESKPKDDIPEVPNPDEDGEVTPPEEDPETKPEETTDISLHLATSRDEVIKPGEEFYYNIDIVNHNSLEKQNIQLTSSLPEGISVVKALEIEEKEGKEVEKEIEYNFDEATRKLTINIDKLEGTVITETPIDEETIETSISIGNKSFRLIVKADNLTDGIYTREIKHTLSLIEEENEIAKSEEIVNTISEIHLDFEIDELPASINELEEFTLGLKIINRSSVGSGSISINVNIPEEISLSKYDEEILSKEGEIEGEETGTLAGNFNKDNIVIPAEKTYYIQLTGNIIDIAKTKQITIKGTINGEEFSKTIEIIDLNSPEKPTDPSKPTNPSNPDDPNDPSDPSDPTKPTNPDDPTKPTEPENPSNPTNPEKPNKPTDAENNENRTQGFDLSLSQYLSKITVTNAKGTTTYNYTDTNFAKVEIHSKQMNGSKVTIEYRIIVKNEGTIPGYANKIANYKPQDLKFDVKINPDWYIADDGNVYSTKLINKLLNPGETAELKLILEKQMTNENVGTITNLVEIYESSNDENEEDVNSIPGDKKEGQNDMSKVEVLISTSTGTIIMYTTLVIVSIAIIALGILKIKKVALNKKGGC